MRLFILLVAISLVCLSFQFEPLSSVTNWQRDLIQDGQWWRILTGNFTHTNFTHLFMNVVGLWIITSIFRPSPLLLLLNVIVISIAVGLLNFLSSMYSYVGLSGVLHGLFASFALNEALNGRKSSWLLVVAVLIKVAWESIMGGSDTTSEWIQARIAVESHLYGALSGLILAGIAHFTLLKTRFFSSIK
ncbi:rhombosortase [Vibrio caribbeanicus]|uniref:Peptidase S54 rhomboid domain-containing protein n=1 Tax=Vibrio caribbeanicus ATCC BAA-2122 TaxID=796620 RepID=E3BHR0_9VIBR|nr:rhombosortase [Vibrio caribbeanicus]EFP97349.1 hypothetical protein VIBC2010_18179 [Vibrio caribbeanicus ATCC BAA-2122]